MPESRARPGDGNKDNPKQTDLVQATYDVLAQRRIQTDQDRRALFQFDPGFQFYSLMSGSLLDFANNFPEYIDHGDTDLLANLPYRSSISDIAVNHNKFLTVLLPGGQVNADLQTDLATLARYTETLQRRPGLEDVHAVMLPAAMIAQVDWRRSQRFNSPLVKHSSVYALEEFGPDHQRVLLGRREERDPLRIFTVNREANLGWTSSAFGLVFRGKTQQ